MMSMAPQPAAGGGGGAVGGGMEKPFSSAEVLRRMMDRVSFLLLNGVSQPGDFFQLCLWFSKAIDSAVANNQRPAKVHDLPQLVKKVYERKCDPSLQPAIMVLMFSIKNACRSGWFQQSDTDALLTLYDEISSRFTSKGNFTTDVNNALPLITQVMSRFCPHLRVCHVIISVEAKPGYNVLVTDFCIPRTHWINPHGRIVSIKQTISNSVAVFLFLCCLHLLVEVINLNQIYFLLRLLVF
ncbi:E4 SUMO-protein ligase [Nymphaea thermarum]|nr:E4 SUMO-protein ligase [Nymphaea thermarum]